MANGHAYRQKPPPWRIRHWLFFDQSPKPAHGKAGNGKRSRFCTEIVDNCGVAGWPSEACEPRYRADGQMDGKKCVVDGKKTDAQAQGG
ncbi:MAG: hypothetical protein DM484_29525 [Candidatus Methylumidiphilus alinenensis]|uniref:Uncharacterized protein n=1 Tax=Candidatus Methylumidiphilus alinenensis TaxID=2202197 RepID=A0A2W4QAS1_9GAMM|nr:MAG: hypothetical protein DM484_29525 [Candidatus Methylumidiphilus alinenensis]